MTLRERFRDFVYWRIYWRTLGLVADTTVNCQRRIAWMMPRWLVYWCTIRLLAHATTGKYGHQIVPELLAMDALERWEKDPPK